MRTPTLAQDGWCLEDGEERHRDAPETFLIPEREIRESLRPGDFAKLIFKISLDDREDTEVVERMWVLVREQGPIGYIGILDSETSSIAENESFWRGTEIPFEPRHIIAIHEANSTSLEIT